MLSAVSAGSILLGIVALALFNIKGTSASIERLIRSAQEFISNLTRLSSGSHSNSLVPAKKIVYTQNEVEQSFSKPTWERQGYEDLVDIILARQYGAKTFPCVYATLGYKAKEQYYCFLKSENVDSKENVAHMGACLSNYLKVARQAGPNTSLVIMAPPPNANEPAKSVDDYLNGFWYALKALRKIDPREWPEEYPQDMSSERWCFCFDGAPFFIVVLTPAHETRYSRWAPNFCMIVQPKWIFDALFSTPQKRTAAIAKVRGFLKHYDEIPVSPDLCDYGTVGSTETRQYFLLDQNETAICPYDDMDA